MKGSHKLFLALYYWTYLVLTGAFFFYHESLGKAMFAWLALTGACVLLEYAYMDIAGLDRSLRKTEYEVNTYGPGYWIIMGVKKLLKLADEHL